MKLLYPRFCAEEPRDHTHRQDSRGRGIRLRRFAAALAVSVLLGGTGALSAQDDSSASVRNGTTADGGANVAALYRLQAAFHRASTVRDPVNGDSDDVINERVGAMLSLWTDNGWLLFNIGSARDGYYIGNGDPANPSTCPAPSDNFANRGTLCTFFKYVAAPFQSVNKFVSLAPSYKTEIHVYGSDATLYFECHFFNVALDPASGKPLWAATGHLSFDGATTKSGKHWLFSRANVQAVSVPVP
ncbi:MAG: hypothetical protein ACJ74Y_17370 [Bryobacteraceae bacterium]